MNKTIEQAIEKLFLIYLKNEKREGSWFRSLPLITITNSLADLYFVLAVSPLCPAVCLELKPHIGVEKGMSQILIIDRHDISP